MKNLVLIGMPGSGKTKMGRLLSQRFSLPLVDTDQLVTEKAGMTIPDIFAAHGEPHFRDLETQAVQEAAALQGAVIATGGGAILRQENVDALRASGVVFFRDRDPAAIIGEDHKGRPLLSGEEDPAEKVYRLYRQRLPLYRAAAHHIIPHTDTYEEAAEQIAALYEKEVRPTVRFLVINGPNLNLLGQREPGIYGKSTYADLCALIHDYAAAHGATAECWQSNHEGAIIDMIHGAQGLYDAIIINPGAYTHYSYAILDALKAVTVPAFEVHISQIDQREPFRAVSVTAPACVGQIYGLGFDGYLRAMDHFLEGV